MVIHATNLTSVTPNPSEPPSTTSQPFNQFERPLELSVSTPKQHGHLPDPLHTMGHPVDCPRPTQLPLIPIGDPMDLNQRQATELTPTERPRPTNQIISDEDPQCAAEIYDEANFDAVGDGLGEDDEYRNDDDEIEDDDESDDDEMEGPPWTASETRKPCRPLPIWLREAFQAKVEECGPQFCDAMGMPPLYARHQTFWFPQPSSFFLLKQKHRSPQLLFNPQFFLWDPEPLCQFGIPCPNCKTTLQRHQVISRPRCCADFKSMFWIIGYRYCCHKCTHPKSGKTTVTFRSWDHCILNVIPPALASEFPAHLSHRSGISWSLFSWMQSCFNYGMGSKQFSDAL